MKVTLMNTYLMRSCLILSLFLKKIIKSAWLSYLKAGKSSKLTLEVRDTMKNIIKVGGLKDDLLVFSENDSTIISHSGEF